MLPVAFGHRKRVGKDRASQFLVSNLRLAGNRGSIERCSIFYEQKLICHKLYAHAGLLHPDYYETAQGEKDKEVVLPKLGYSPREVYIKFALGTSEISPTTGIDYLFDICGDRDILVISDLRRIEEAERIHELGGFVIRIDRPEAPISDDPIDMAMSEYTKWDAIIKNDGDLNKLHQEITRVASELKL